ncbi:MAG TPA: TolC family protein [Opitutaceae bacterium]|jgi:outer membrane protein|nr:TolC family protein [Opitutaceae bacterium]
MTTLRIFAAFILAAGLSRSLAAQQPGQLLTLDDAVRLALEKNQNIKVEAYAPKIARANWLTAIGQFDPALTFGRNYTRSYDYPSISKPLPSELVEADHYNLALAGILPTGLNYSVGGSAENVRGPFNNFTDNYSTFGGVTITQPLLRGFGFGANLANVRIAKANRSISEWDYRQTVISTITNVAVTYSNLALAHDELRIAHSSRDLAATLLTENEKRLKIGSMAQSDVITAHTQVAMREEAILVAEHQVRSTENQLRELIGEDSFPPDQPLLVIDPPATPDMTIKPAEDLQKALKYRPDYQAARLGLVIDHANDASARNGLLPQVDFVGSYGYNGLDHNFAVSRHMVSDHENSSYSAGVVVTIPLTFAQGRGRARAARLQMQQDEADLTRFEADIAVNVANAADQIETTRQRVVADRTAYALAKQALDDEVKKLRAGTSSTLSVIQAQQILISVENSMVTALAAQYQAVANYDQQLGTTMLRHNITLADQ